MLGSVKYNGIDSSSFGLLVNYRTISIKPLKRSSVVNVIGKNGGQVFSDKYDMYEIILDCRLKGDIKDRRLIAREIAQWLNTNNGELILGIEPDVKYQAWPLKNVKVDRLTYVLENFFVSFLVQPVKRNVYEDDPLVWETADVSWDSANVPWEGFDSSYENITSGDVLEITNNGNEDSLPTMIISGQATTISIIDDNGVEFTFADLNGTIYVDSDNLLVYSGTTTKINEIKDSNSEFITLNVGDNTIDVSGTGFVNLNIEFKNVSAYI